MKDDITVGRFRVNRKTWGRIKALATENKIAAGDFAGKLIKKGLNEFEKNRVVENGEKTDK